MSDTQKGLIAFGVAIVCTWVYIEFCFFAAVLLCDVMIRLILKLNTWCTKKKSERAYLYHVTEKENVESIMKEGLRRNAKRRAAMVYLSENPLSWYRDGLIILRVDIRGLSHIKATTYLPELDEIMFWGDIPPTKHTIFGYKPRIKDVTEKYTKTRAKEGE